jgi:hypothetical protein
MCQKHIRGAGLAYGASVDVEEEYGLVTFSVYRSPDAFKAFEAAGKVLQGLADGTVRADDDTVISFVDDPLRCSRPSWTPTWWTRPRALCRTLSPGEKATSALQ